jgi:hypothetical protein
VPWSKKNIKSGTTKVYDCIAIADGKKTLAQIRGERNARPDRISGRDRKILLSPQRKTSCGRHLIFSPGGKLA